MCRLIPLCRLPRFRLQQPHSLRPAAPRASWRPEEASSSGATCTHTHRSPFLGTSGLAGGPVPSVSTWPRGSDVGHHTPSLRPRSSAWVAHTSHCTPASTPIHAAFPHASPLTEAGPFSRKEAGTRPAWLPRPEDASQLRGGEGERATAQRIRRAWAPRFPSDTKPSLGLRVGALETQKWGQMGALRESLPFTSE